MVAVVVDIVLFIMLVPLQFVSPLNKTAALSVIIAATATVVALLTLKLRLSCLLESTVIRLTLLLDIDAVRFGMFGVVYDGCECGCYFRR